MRAAPSTVKLGRGSKKTAADFPFNSHDALLAVLEAALLTGWGFTIFAPLAARLTAFALSCSGLAADVSRYDFQRAHVAVAHRARGDHRVVLERQMHDAAVARRHRLQ